MPKRIDLLVIEDDEPTCLAYENYCKDREDIILAGTSASSAESLRMTEKLQPNAVILDLELTNGGGSGIDYLMGIDKLALEVVPYILVVTNNISQTTYAAVRNLGADFIIAKSQSDYSIEFVMNFLRSIIDSLSDMSPGSKPKSPDVKKQIEDDYNKRILKRIDTELDAIGVSPRFKGRNYLRDAIEIICHKEQPSICQIIGQRYNKTASSVERAMQNAINRAWKTTDTTTLEEQYKAYINPKKGIPTLTEFIYYFASKVKHSMKI